MAARRSAAVVVVIVFVLAGLGVSARSQFGNLLKKTLPRPATAGVPPKPLYCADITSEKVEQLLKGLKAERAAHEKAQALEKAAKGVQAANDDAAVKRMMEAMERQAACEQAAQEKDPRFKQAERLSELRNKAQDRGDEAAAEKYGEQFAALTDELENMAQKACIDSACLVNARAKSELNTAIAEFRAAAAREGNPERKAAHEAQITAYSGMIESEAIMACSATGAAAPSAAEQAASEAAANAARNAKDAKEAEGAKAADATAAEYARLKECATGALNKPAATPLTPESRQAIDQRQPDLEPALKASGN